MYYCVTSKRKQSLIEILVEAKVSHMHQASQAFLANHNSMAIFLYEH